MLAVVKGQFLWMCECVRGGRGERERVRVGGCEGANEKIKVIKGRCWRIDREDRIQTEVEGSKESAQCGRQGGRGW